MTVKPISTDGTLEDATEDMMAAATRYINKLCDLAIDLCPSSGRIEKISCQIEMDTNGFRLIIGSETAFRYISYAYDLLKETFPPDIIRDLDPIFSGRIGI